MLPSEAKHHYPTTFKTVIGVMCATIGLTLIITFFMARENKRRDAEQFPPSHGQTLGHQGGLENEKDMGALEREGDEEYIQRDVSDGQNKSFRYTL